jgi:hypothetical protein
VEHPVVNCNGFITPEAAIMRALSLLMDADDPDELPRLDQVDLCLRADAWSRVALVLTQTGAMHVGPLLPAHEARDQG